jgi:hypothetical protein
MTTESPQYEQWQPLVKLRKVTVEASGRRLNAPHTGYLLSMPDKELELT